jgi:hypothetical protein
LDKGFAFPYGALITRIAEHFRVNMTGLREIQPEKGSMGVHFLNASQALAGGREGAEGIATTEG